MLGPFDKPAELRIQPLPFDMMFQMAEKRQLRGDKTQEQIDNLQGAFASLQAAPGHEEYKVKALEPYQKAISNFMTKYQDPSDPRAVRELTQLKSSFMNDQNVQNILQSKQLYDKLVPELYKAKNTDAVFTSPVMNKQGEFQKNEQLYTPDKLSFIPQADINPEIDKDLAKVSPYIHQNNFLPSIRYMTGPNGEKVPMIQQGQTVHERKSYAEFNKSIDAIVDNILQQNTDASRWFIPKNDQGDPVKTRAYVKQYVTNKAISYFYDNEKTDLSFSQFNGGDKEKAGVELFEQAQPFEYVSGEQRSLDEIKSSNNVIESSPTQFPIMGGGMGSSGNIEHTVKNPGSISERFGNLSKTTQYGLLDIAKKIKIAQVPSQWTEENWKDLEVELSKRKPVRVAPVAISYRNPEYVKREGETIDNNLENNVFYDPQDKQVFSGVQLRKAGWEAVGKTGYLSSYNVTSIQVPGTNNKASFASPDIVKLKNADGTVKTMYMGINKSQITDQYVKDLVKNKISVASQIKYPTQLLEGDDSIIILPFENPEKGNPKYSFKLGIEGYDTPFEFEAATQEDYDKMVSALIGPNPTDSKGSTLPGIQNFIITSLFND